MSHEMTILPAERPASRRRTTPISALPPEFLEQARFRLRRVMFALAALSSLALLLAIFNLVASKTLGTPLGARLGVAVHAIVLVLEVVMLALASSARISHARALDLFLVWEVAVCLAFSILGPWIVVEEQGVIPRVTWVSLIIVSVPLIIPGPPRRMLAAACVSAGTVPLGLWIVNLGGAARVTGAEVAGAMITPAFAVAVAYFGARVIYGISRDIAAARRMGSYVLEARLGRGGMGEVWQARHRLLARPAAIKLIRADLLTDHSGGATSAPVKRFKREAEVISTLRSPHTVQLYDFGVAEDGTLYYVMELLEGIDLERLVRRFGPQPPARVAGILIQACHSLGEAHEAGLVHRDIKPGNVVLCRYGPDVDFVKVLDFGLVALQRDRLPEQTALTAEGRVAGTPAYMAPETVNKPDAVDRRADIYCLGCVAYWMLAGKPVFTAHSPVAVIADHLKTPPPPLSEVCARGVPAALEEIVMSCLEKDPAKRPKSAWALTAALKRNECDRDWKEGMARDWWASYLPLPSDTMQVMQTAVSDIRTLETVREGASAPH